MILVPTYQHECDMDMLRERHPNSEKMFEGQFAGNFNWMKGNRNKSKLRMAIAVARIAMITSSRWR